MIKVTLPRVLLLLSLCASASVFAVTTETRSISVNGQAEVKVVPDEVVIRLGVESRDKALAAARKQNDAAISAILATAKRFGVDEKLVQTSYIHVEPRYKAAQSSGYGDSSVIDYYVVSKDVEVALRDVAKFESLLGAVLEGGANRVSGVQFNTTEQRKYRDAARKLAVAAAREKAVLLAGELGLKVGKAITISEEESGVMPMANVMGKFMAASAGGGPSIALGQISVSATVNIRFELE